MGRWRPGVGVTIELPVRPCPSGARAPCKGGSLRILSCSHGGSSCPGILRVWGGGAGRTWPSHRFGVGLARGEDPGNLLAAVVACAGHCDQTQHLTRLPGLGPAAMAGRARLVRAQSWGRLCFRIQEQSARGCLGCVLLPRDVGGAKLGHAGC